MKEQLRELAARCESADGPSDELDLAIARASLEFGFPIFGDRVNYDPALWIERYGNITASLDAVMSMLPEGCVFKVMTDFGLPGRATVYTRLCAWSAGAATPALALTAACLRAHAERVD